MASLPLIRSPTRVFSIFSEETGVGVTGSDEVLFVVTGSGVADDTVLEEATKAYVHGDDVLRVAHVIVAKSE